MPLEGKVRQRGEGRVEMVSAWCRRVWECHRKPPFVELICVSM
jgi:hypothetical protein